MKTLAILGSTGSIGKNTLQVLRENPNQFRITALSANLNIDLLAQQALEFRPRLVSIFHEKLKAPLEELLKNQGIAVKCGLDGNIECALSGDILVTALVGRAGLVPTMEAIRKKVEIRLANKETLVAAGELVMEEARKYGISIIPIDSEHCAIFQCLEGHRSQDISRLIITGSGGPFRKTPFEEMQNVTLEKALDHPVWKMGGKITIDSATLMNKGLEVIEARWLFDVPYEKIAVIIHPQGIIHSMVEFKDGQILAQLGIPDMKLPIAYALSYPKRFKVQEKNRLKLTEMPDITFEEPDFHRFPCLALAYKCAKIGGIAPTVLNGANEIAVEYFLNKRANFMDIPETIEKVTNSISGENTLNIDYILEKDQMARKMAREFLEGKGGAQAKLEIK